MLRCRDFLKSLVRHVVDRIDEGQIDRDNSWKHHEPRRRHVVARNAN
jgi:hypothetical protein